MAIVVRKSPKIRISTALTLATVRRLALPISEVVEAAPETRASRLPTVDGSRIGKPPGRSIQKTATATPRSIPTTTSLHCRKEHRCILRSPPTTSEGCRLLAYFFFTSISWPSRRRSLLVPSPGLCPWEALLRMLPLDAVSSSRASKCHALTCCVSRPFRIILSPWRGSQGLEDVGVFLLPNPHLSARREPNCLPNLPHRQEFNGSDSSANMALHAMHLHFLRRDQECPL
jgi:hypothetical protein